MENDTPEKEKEEVENIEDPGLFDDAESTEDPVHTEKKMPGGEEPGLFDDAENSEAPVHVEKRMPGGEYLFSIVLLILGCFIAVPSLFIYLLKSPLPQQDVYTFGISYYNLVFVFLISAAVIIVSLLFFFKSSVPVTLVIFMTCLFCCMPLIMALKNNLTLQQAIENIPFFIHFPFFLRPLYILVEFLLPAGILAFLFLQMKNIFSKKPNNYIFTGAAGYLATAAFIGFTGLLQAGQPNIMTVLAAKDTVPVVDSGQAAVISSVPELRIEKLEQKPPGGALSAEPQGESTTAQPEKQPLQKTLPVEYSAIAMIDRKVQLLQDKMDAISTELEQVRISLKGLDRSAPGGSGSLSPVPRNGQLSDANVPAENNQGAGGVPDSSNPLEKPRAQFTKPVFGDQTPAIVEIRHKVEQLTAKVDMLLSRFNQAGYSKPPQSGRETGNGVQQPVTRDQDALFSELAEVLQKIELLSDKVNRISDVLAQNGDREGRLQEHRQ